MRFSFSKIQLDFKKAQRSGTCAMRPVSRPKRIYLIKSVRVMILAFSSVIFYQIVFR